MPYVLRQNGVVVAVAASRQEGWQEEFLPEDHPDVVAYNTPPESFEAAARRVLDESASVSMLVQLAPILPSVLLFAQAGTVKGIQTALAILAGIPLPSELEDERKLLIKKLGG